VAIRRVADYYLNGALEGKGVDVAVAFGTVRVSQKDGPDLGSFTITSTVREDTKRLAYVATNEAGDSVQLAFITRDKGCGCGAR